MFFASAESEAFRGAVRAIRNQKRCHGGTTPLSPNNILFYRAIPATGDAGCREIHAAGCMEAHREFALRGLFEVTSADATF
jgi:hypothetical protein